MIEREESAKYSLLGHSVSRRIFLRGIGGLAAGAVVLKNGERIYTVSEATIKYGPGFAEEAVMHPEETLDIIDILRTPEPNYLVSPSFSEPLLYQRGVGNNVMGFGDSNIVGPNGKEWQQSPIVLYRDLANKRLGTNWGYVDCAKSGYTTNMIREEQVNSQRARAGFDISGRCDVWVNAGGNDFSHLITSNEEVNELQQLSDNPVAHPDLLGKYASRILSAVGNFSQRFSELLNAIDDTYRGKIRQFVIMSLPDFTRAQSIKTQEINGAEHIISLESATARDLIQNITVRMNNKMFESVDKFQKESGNRMVGIDTGTPQISDFSSNQHFSIKACEAIAQNAFDRIRFVNGA